MQYDVDIVSYATALVAERVQNGDAVGYTSKLVLHLNVINRLERDLRLSQQFDL